MARRLAGLLVTVAVVVGCTTAPSASPSEAGRTAPPGTATTTSPGPDDSGPLADALRDSISIPDITADLGKLQAIAEANGGTRAAGTPGHDASADFVATELAAAGLRVHRQPVTITAFTQTAPSVVAITGGTAFDDIRDFKAMTFSASGDVTGPVVTLGWDPNVAPDTFTGLGCNPGDWAGVPRGAIVLMQPGPCRRHDVVVLAQEAGALAVITTYAAWPRDGIRRPTLVVPADIHVPVIGATHAVGVALAQAAASGSTVHVSTATSTHRCRATT